MKPLIRISKDWKDLVEGPKHQPVTRRDFIKRGLLTATIATAMPEFLLNSTAAYAATNPSCPPQIRVPGAIAQIYRDGGNARGAMFLNSQQANAMNATMAKNYGIVGASDLQQVGSNYYLAKSSPYTMAILTPPAGYTQAQWNQVLLTKTSFGGIYGPWNNDDGAGSGLGQLGTGSPYKSSFLGKDIRFDNSRTVANWAHGTPSISVNVPQQALSTLNSTSVVNLAGFTPSGVLNQAQVQASATTAYTLSSIFSQALGLSTRTGAAQAVTKTYCGFNGNGVLADPSFAASSFNPNNISALTSKIQVANLSTEQQCLLGSFYASAVGTCGAIIIQQNGNDYHQGSAEAIATQDYEAGQFFQMFIAACDAAGQPGIFLEVSNGNCVGGGVQPYVLPNGQTTQAAIGKGDAGGMYNVGFAVCYHPTTPPTLSSMMGTSNPLNTTTGAMLGTPLITSVPAGMGALYLTALKYVGGDVNSAFAQMVANRVFPQATPTGLTLLG